MIADIARNSGIHPDHFAEWTTELTPEAMAVFMTTEAEEDIDPNRYLAAFEGGGLMLHNALTGVDALYPFNRDCPLGKYPIPTGSELPVWAPRIDGVLGRTWKQVAESGERIYLVEGYKKAMAAISALGVPAIALPGTWFKKADEGKARKIPAGLKPFVDGRQIVLCFDRETNPATRARVEMGLFSCANELQWLTKNVFIAELPTVDGLTKTGLDDYILNCGANNAKRILENALPYHQAHLRYLESCGQANYQPQYNIREEWFGNSALELPETGIVGIRLPKGRGKTSGTFRKLKGTKSPIVMLCPLQRLRLSAKRQARKADIQLLEFAVDHPDIAEMSMKEIRDGKHRDKNFVLCAESAKRLSIAMLQGATVIIDEARQLATSMLESGTMKAEARANTFETLRIILPHAKRLILLDADLDDSTIEFWKSLSDQRFSKRTVTLIADGLEKPTGFDFEMLGSTYEMAISKATQLVAAGYRVLISVDSLKYSKAAAITAQQQCSSAKVLEVNSETCSQQSVQAFFDNPDREVKRYNLVIASPSMRTGVSIEVPQCFDAIFVIAGGRIYSDADISQAAWRVRDKTIPRFIYTPQYWDHSMAHRLSSSKKATDVIHQLRGNLDRTSSNYTNYGFLSAIDNLQNVVVAEYYDSELKFHANQIALYNISLGNLREYTRARFLNEGCNEGSLLSKFDVGDTQRVSCHAIQHIHQTVKADSLEALVTAPVNNSTLSNLLKTGNHSPQQKAQVTATLTSNYFGHTNPPTTMEINAYLNQQDNIDLIIASFTSEEGYATFGQSIIRAQRDGMFVLAGDINTSARAGQLIKHLNIPQLLLQAWDAPLELTDEMVKTVYKQTRARKKLPPFKPLLGVSAPRDLGRVRAFLNPVLRKLGFEVKSKKSNDIRTYILSPTGPLLTLAERRYKARLGLDVELFPSLSDECHLDSGNRLQNPVVADDSSNRHPDRRVLLRKQNKLAPSSPLSGWPNYEPEVVQQSALKIWIKFPELAKSWLLDISRVEALTARETGGKTTYKLTGQHSDTHVEAVRNGNNGGGKMIPFSELEIGMKRRTLSAMKQAINEELLGDF